MNAKELYYRGNNLALTTITALAGFAFLAEVFSETEAAYKIDDGILFILGLVAIWWYRRGRNRFVRSWAPVFILGLALLDKIGAAIVEHADQADLGDDLGALVLFVLAIIFGIILLRQKSPAE